MFVVSVQPGQEVIDTVTAELGNRGVRNGAIVSLVGAVDSCCISNMPKGDPKNDILTEYEQPFEMAGTGEVKDGKPHIHCVLGREGDISLAGHLHWARVNTWFVNVYIAEMLNNQLKTVLLAAVMHSAAARTDSSAARYSSGRKHRHDLAAAVVGAGCRGRRR